MLYREAQQTIRRQKKIAFVMVIVIVIETIMIIKNVSNEIDTRIENAYNFGYEKGFDACIEENNLYNNYPKYMGDEKWENN